MTTKMHKEVHTQLDRIAMALEEKGHADLASLVDQANADLADTAKKAVQAKAKPQRTPVPRRRPKSGSAPRRTRKAAHSVRLSSKQRKVVAYSITELRKVAQELIKDKDFREARAVLKYAEELEEELEAPADEDEDLDVDVDVDEDLDDEDADDADEADDDDDVEATLREYMDDEPDMPYEDGGDDPALMDDDDIDDEDLDDDGDDDMMEVDEDEDLDEDMDVPGGAEDKMAKAYELKKARTLRQIAAQMKREGAPTALIHQILKLSK